MVQYKKLLFPTYFPLSFGQSLETMTIMFNIIFPPPTTCLFDSLLQVNVTLNQKNTQAQGNKLVGSLSHMPDLNALKTLDICPGL